MAKKYTICTLFCLICVLASLCLGAGQGPQEHSQAGDLGETLGIMELRQ